MGDKIAMIYLSLCIPTNGIEEWVFPVLDRIYEQNVNSDQWEVIVTDNGDNEVFHEKMLNYAEKHEKLIYKKTKAFLFENQIEALRLASGEYLKFMNHRSLLEDGALQWMLNLVKDNMDEKPIIYLSNGELRYKKPQNYATFDEFVRGLKEYASWTTGVGVWKSDFEKMPNDWKYNKISPHSDVLFRERGRSRYLIDDTIWSHDIDASHEKKGKYDLYKAFACEEITITLQLYIDGDISGDTLKYIIKCYEKCVARFYCMFNIMHIPCSYNLKGFDEAMGIFIKKENVIMRAYLTVPQMVTAKIFRYLVRKK